MNEMLVGTYHITKLCHHEVNSSCCQINSLHCQINSIINEMLEVLWGKVLNTSQYQFSQQYMTHYSLQNAYTV